MSGSPAEPTRVFLIAGELSGDQLGAGLMRALKAALGGRVRFQGVGYAYPDGHFWKEDRAAH